MSRPLVVAIAGPPHSGKSALMSGLLPHLTRHGIQTALAYVLDASGSVAPDLIARVPSRDLCDGAACVVVMTSDMLATSWAEDDPRPQWPSILAQVDADLVLAEGLRLAGAARIEIDPPPGPVRGDDGLIAVVGEGGPDCGVPVFGRGDVEGLARFLAEWRGERAADIPPPDDFELTVDGRPVPVKPIIRRILARAVLGALSVLRGCEEPEWIELRFRRGAGDETSWDAQDAPQPPPQPPAGETGPA